MRDQNDNDLSMQDSYTPSGYTANQDDDSDGDSGNDEDQQNDIDDLPLRY